MDRRSEGSPRERAMMLATTLLTVTGYLIEARGVFLRHRHNASRASPASMGSEVHSGDTVRVTADAKARILCSDLTTTWRPVPKSWSGVFEGCPEASERIRSRQGQ